MAPWEIGCFLHACSLMLSTEHMQNRFNSKVQVAKYAKYEIHGTAFLNSLPISLPCAREFSVCRITLLRKIKVSHIITCLFHLQVKTGRFQLWRRECDHRPWLSQPGLGLSCLSARQGTWLGAVFLPLTCCETRRKSMHPPVLPLCLCQFEVLNSLMRSLSVLIYCANLPWVDFSQGTE